MTGRSSSQELNSLLAELQASPLAGNVQANAPLGALTTYRVGGNAALLATLNTQTQLEVLASFLANHTEVSVAVIGKGSNLLVSDEGFAGIALMLGQEFADIGVDNTIITAGGAAKFPVVARVSVRAGLSGMEWAIGVPGSVGGAVRMNAGGHGEEIKDSLVEAEVFNLQTGESAWHTNQDLDFKYRHSRIARHEIITQAKFELTPEDPTVAQAKLLELVQWRRQNQPGGANAGSVFTNPDGDSAGRLIEAAGAKGLRINTAQVSDKHANFFCPDPNGKANDIFALMLEVQRRVKEEIGVSLAYETKLLGFDGHSSD